MKKRIFVLFLIVVSILALSSCSIANKKVESLQILSGAPAEVQIGDTPDFSDLKVKVTYNDGETKEVGYSDVTISSIDTSKVGKIEYTVSYEGGSVTTTINVKSSSDGPSITDVTLASITYLSGIQTTFYEGADFHLTDLKVTAHYSDGLTKTVTSDKLTVIQNIDPDTVGEQTLIVEYLGKRCEIKINVLKKAPSKFTFQLNSFDKQILVGGTLDTSAITGVLHYNNSTIENISNSDITFSTVDTATTGTKTLVGTYNGMSAKCNIEVVGVQSIDFSGFERSIKFNETLDLSNLIATVTATNGKSYTIPADKITVDKTKFDQTLNPLDGVHEKTTKIAFSYYGSSKEYNITVYADRTDAELIKLEYVSGLDKQIFVTEPFNGSGIKAKASFTFGYTEILTIESLTLDGSVNNAEIGSYPLTYSYTDTENGITKSFTVNIEVIEPSISGLLLSETNLGYLIKGETLDTSNITAYLYYEYGSTKDSVENDELVFSEIDSTVTGQTTITVTHPESGMTATATITVVEIASVEFTGINNSYRLNTTFDTSKIKVTITDTNGNIHERSFNANVTLPTLTLDITKSEETKEYVFTYCGVEFKKDIEVYAEFEDAELINIEYNGALTVFKGDAIVVSVKANYTYGFTKIYSTEDGVTTSDFTSASLGDYELTVTYMDKTDTVTVSVIMPKVTDIVVNSAPYGIKGEAYNFNKINLTLYLENGKTVESELENLVDYGITANLDVTVAGNKTLTITANGVSETKQITVYEIEKIVINTDNFKNIVQLGSTFSTEGLGKIYVYLVGMQEPTIREVTEFTHNVDTSVTGNDYTITTTYLGIVSEPVKVTVADQNFIITGVADPASIVAWKNKTYSSKFLDSGYYYFVGDDNPFKYELNFQMFDIINEVPELKGLKYVSKSTVTLDGVEVGEEYVKIDEVNHTFDFTENAIGKNFIITTAHKDYPDYVTSIHITVVDAYNISENNAIELNLLTNYNAELGNSGKTMLTLLHPFLASNNVAGIENMSYEQYTEYVNSINGIVIHSNLILNQSDFPSEYFFTAKDGTKYIWDHQSIFYRVFTESKSADSATEVFNLYGNYFTIVSNNIPTVALKGTIDVNGVASNDDNEISSSELIRINASGTLLDNVSTFYSDKYVCNIYALGFHDNDPSVPVQSELAAIRSKLGIMAIKVAHATYNLNAVNIEAYFSALMAEYDDLTVNLNYCTFYNSWNNHISTWSSNILDQNDNDDYDGSIHEGYRPITVNINKSFISKCGGPVIMSMCKNPTSEFNTKAGSKSIIKIDNESTVFSYVKGDESWFKSYGATNILEKAKQWNLLFESFTPKSSFEINIGGDKFFNLIALNMDADFNPLSMSNITSDIDGTVTIGDKILLDMDDTYGSYGHNGIVDAIHAAAQGQPAMPPIFVSDVGGASYTDDSNLFIADLPDYNDAMDKAAALTGEYLSGYLYNLGFLFGFNEEPLEKEPTIADCTVVRITEPHGIN